MIIYCYDGSYCECETIEFTDKDIIVDECRILPIIEVVRIVSR